MTDYLVKALPAGLGIIAKILHSKFASTIAPRVLEESKVNTIAPQLDKIEKGIQELQMKDLKTAQNLFRDVFRDMRRKLECFDSLTDENLEQVSDKVNNAVIVAQNHAITAISGKLSAVDALEGYSFVVATEMLLVLNEATRRR